MHLNKEKFNTIEALDAFIMSQFDIAGKLCPFKSYCIFWTLNYAATEEFSLPNAHLHLE